MKSVETNQTKAQWTAQEKELAQEHGVEPKTVRLIDAIVQHRLEQPQEAEPQSENGKPDSETPEAVDEVSPEAETDVEVSQSEKMLKKWLLDRDYKTKLACVIVSTLQINDHGTNDLADEIIGKYDDEILATAANPPENISSDELLMTGVVVEQGIWCAHY